MFGKLSHIFSRKVAKNDSTGGASQFTSLGAPVPAGRQTSGSGPLFSAQGTFFFKPYASASFEPLTALDVATLSIVPNGVDSSKRPQYLLSVIDPDEGDEPALEQAVDQAMNLSYHHDTGAVMWTCVHEGNLRDLCFRFTKRGADSRKFVEEFNMCVYRSLADPAIKNDDDDNATYIANTFTHLQPMRDAQSPEPAEAETQDELFTFEPQRDRSVIRGATNIKNMCFADSIQYTRAIVLREVAGGAKEIRALKYNNDGFVAGGDEGFLVEAMANMRIREDKDNQSLLSADEKHLLALNTGGSIMDVDLTQGSVVAEYKGKDKYPIIAVTNRSKYADEDPNLICCLSNNVAFSIDKRMDPSSAVVTEAGKDTEDYALGSLKKPMTCHATSAKGQLVIGDSVGALRLYTGPPGTQRAAGGYHPKTAKTLLQTAGQAILSVDISADGKFVLATTADHVMLFPIEYLDGGKALNGCDNRMGKNKPQPLRLVPSPEQLRVMGTAAKFTGAHFDTDKNSRQEKWIIASCNNHILTWSLPSVIAALDDNRNVSSDMTKEGGQVRQVDMRGNRNTLTYMTEKEIGTERRSDKPKKKGLSYFTFE